MNRVPMATITSAPSIMSLIGPTAPTQVPMLLGCEYGITPLPPAELTTGIPVISASSRNSSNASERAMPPAAKMTADFAFRISFAASPDQRVSRCLAFPWRTFKQFDLFPLNHPFRRHIDESRTWVGRTSYVEMPR